MAFNPIAPVTEPGKNTNKATKNADGTVTLNDKVQLNEEGQDAVFRKKYEMNAEEPYLGKYGANYADKEGFETKGGNIMSYKDGQVNFNKRYNRDDQEAYMERVRSLPENKGRDIYLSGSQNPKYMAPAGYKGGKTTQTLNPSAPIK